MNKKYKTWEERFNELLKFKEKFGRINVPYKDHRAYSLSIWVYNQRRAYRMGKLSQKYIEILISVGFKFEVSRKNSKHLG